jgi:hypothetical protein
MLPLHGLTGRCSYYIFNPRRMNNLRIGADMLREAIDLESEKQARAVQAKMDEKVVAEAAAEKVDMKKQI